MPSFSTRTQKHTILACMTLYNFIRVIASFMVESLFGRCDADEEYLLEVPCAPAQTQGDKGL